MNLSHKAKRLSALVLTLVIILSAGVCCLTAFAADDEIYDSLDDLSGKTIGVITGTPYDTIVEKKIENPDIMYIQTFGDSILAIKTGKIDALVADEAYSEYMTSSETDLAILDISMEEQQFALAFSKNEKGEEYCKEINSYIAELKADGTLDEMAEVWSDATTENPEIDLDSLTGENGTLKLTTDATNPPFDFVENDEIIGYEIDLLYRFCKAEGYKLEITNVNFDSLIPGVTTGKYDVAACGFAITDERKESVNFSDPIFDNNVVLIVNKANTAEGAAEDDSSFLSDISESFRKTFINESRWKMFLSGIGRTLLITVISLVLGTLLGFVLYMWYRTGSKISGIVTNAFDWLMNRMPMVVLLLILFYVVFADSDMSGSAVSVFGFTLVFGSNVYGMIKGGVNAIDKGQMEAGLALGYKPLRAFFKVVFPQAAIHFIPDYEGSIISLINSTAIVGYVAVQDLTKVSDIVRSRTYDAFFPLIATAVIYIALAELLIFIVRIFERIFMPGSRKHKKFMKGVRRNDRT